MKDHQDILFCITVMNLFENEGLTNGQVKEKILVLHLVENANLLDQTPVAKKEIPAGYHWIPGYADDAFLSLIQKAIAVLDDDLSSDYRYGYHGLRYTDRIKRLFWDYQLSDKQMLSYTTLVENPIYRMHLLLFIISFLIEQDRIQETYSYIQLLPEASGETQSKGYLKLLEYFAQRSDLAAFKETLKHCNARINRSEVAICKQLFVCNYAKNNALDAILKLIPSTLFTKTLLCPALCAYAEKQPYLQIAQLIDSHPLLQPLLAEEKTQILLSAFQHDGNANHDSVLFDYLFAAIDNVDNKIRFGDFKLRDSLLLDLGLAVKHNSDWVTRCRKAIKNNRLKKELAV